MQCRFITMLAATLLLCACRSYEPQAARLNEAETGDQERQVLLSAVSAMLNGARVSLSDSAFISSSELIVEQQRSINSSPGASLDRDYGRPDHFRLWLQDRKCLLEHIETGNTQIIDELSCRAE